MRRRALAGVLAGVTGAYVAACSRAVASPARTASRSQSPAALAASRETPALRDVFKGDFRIGAAINANQFTGRDAAGAGLIARQFNTVSPENVLKWEIVHPRPGVYEFEPGDAYVAFGER